MTSCPIPSIRGTIQPLPSHWGYPYLEPLKRWKVPKGFWEAGSWAGNSEQKLRVAAKPEEADIKPWVGSRNEGRVLLKVKGLLT